MKNIPLLDLYKKMLSENNYKFNVEYYEEINFDKARAMCVYIKNSFLENKCPTHDYSFSREDIKSFINYKSKYSYIITPDAHVLILDNLHKSSRYSESITGKMQEMNYDSHIDFIINHGGNLEMIINEFNIEIEKEKPNEIAQPSVFNTTFENKKTIRRL